MDSKPEVTACLSVIIPAYNEEATLARVVGEVLKLSQVLEIIVVDDGSTDGTRQVCEELNRIPRVRTVILPRNQGKCEALKAGFAISTGEIVIIQDADLEYDPREIPDVIQPILEGQADVVYGSRFLVRKATRVLYFYHFVANKCLTLFSNLLTNVNFTDVETGYKAFRGEIIRNMRITSRGFGIEIEMTAKIAKLGCAIYEVPISYYGRTYEQGKKIGLSDGIEALWYIVKFNFFCSLQASFIKLPNLKSLKKSS
ncbi:MAG TPA: glycosyltransferase family 2 protein [Bryobacteraceae bacterium]|nr:glycosyltransferase family 2 protein [Bryobacteraceae bacterium]